VTAEQAAWLNANKPYRAVGQRAGSTEYLKRGILHADGRFELILRGVRPNITPGCFEVAVLHVKGTPMPNPGF
jgi:hypothetical protein